MTADRGSRRAGPGTARATVVIARSELSRILRDRTQLFFVVVLPVVIIILVGATMGSAPDHLVVAVVDQDGSAAAAQLRDALERSETLETRSASDTADVEREIRTGELNGAVVIRRGYGDAVASGSPVTVELLAKQTDSTTSALQRAVSSVTAGEGEVLAATAFALQEGSDDVAAVRARAEALDRTLPRLDVTVETVGVVSRQIDNNYAYTAPSNLVLFVFINSLVVGGALVESRRLGVLRRMYAAPIPAEAIVLGSGLTRFVFALLQSALILLVGGLLFGVPWGSPPAAALLVLLFALLSTGAGLLIGVFARNPEQASVIGIPVAMAMAMLGGCMWPLEVVPEPMRIVGHLTPHAWAMDGWIELIFEGRGLDAIWVDLVVLAGFAVVLLSLATWRLRRTLTT